MSAETNKLVMHRFTEFINTASQKLAEELISANVMFHVPRRNVPIQGPAGYLEHGDDARGIPRYSMDPPGRAFWRLSNATTPQPA